ncbi:hypothetical protein FACS1894178_0790 [Bacteroidia bacterium]|nr:hypothetical protein FACS1894178_0790 [Bacteroidia bacterium]
MIYHLSQQYGGLWYLKPEIFANKPEKKLIHPNIIDDLKKEFLRSKEIFAKKFREDCKDKDPDAWIIFEVATFGTLSKLYEISLHQLPEKSMIANEFGLHLHNDLSSWLESISYIRNVIAHHSRIFGRNIIKRPVLTTKTRNKWLEMKITENQEKKPFVIIAIMIYLCNSINPKNKIKEKLLNLFKNNPNIPFEKLGFTNNWREEAFWK